MTEAGSGKMPEKKGKKWLPFVIIGVSVVVIAVAVIVGVNLFGKKTEKLDLLEYLEVEEVTGFDGQGVLRYSFDYAALAEDLEFEEVKDVRELAEIQEEKGYTPEYVMENVKDLADEHDLELDELKDLFKTVSVSLEENGAFSNGDVAVIEVKVKEDKTYGDRLEGGELEHEIEGLKALLMTKLNVACSFYGADGEGQFDCRITDEAEAWHPYVVFSCRENGSLSNGDKARVTASLQGAEVESIRAQLLSEGYILPESFSFEFTVSGLTVPLTAEDCTDGILEQAEGIVRENVRMSNDELEHRVSMIYFVEDRGENHIVVALEFPDEAARRTWNHIRYLKNVSVTPDGVLEYDSVEHVLGGNGFNESQQEDYIESFDDFYGCELTKLR